MKYWSFKVKVGVYAALLTMVALVAGCLVMMLTLYFHQISELDELLEDEAGELVWDLKNFRDAPKDPNEPVSEKFISLPLRLHYLELAGPQGKVVYRSANLRGTSLHVNLGEAKTTELFGDTCRLGAWREGPYLIRIGAKVNTIERFVRDLGIGFVTALPVVGLVVFFGGVWLARRTVAPVAELSAAAERISASNPKERLPLPLARDEIAKLTEVLNRSFDRLQESYAAAARFSGDASHQLKTPVAILRAGLDHLSRQTELSEEQADEVAILKQQTRRLTSLIEDLLLLAKADGGRMEVQRLPVDLVGLVEAASDDLFTLLDDKGIVVEQDLPEDLSVTADRRLLAVIFQNLVENAAKYTPEGGKIQLTASRDGQVAVVSVANTGEGILDVDRAFVFERFRRGTNIGGGIRGHGLGLNIARELALAHGGDLILKTATPGWTIFELRLPVGSPGLDP